MLGMKKTLGLVMATAMVAGCATNPVQINQVKETTAKVDSVKVTPSFDLGEKDGASFKMSLKLTGKSAPFGIKAFNPDSFASGAINSNGFLVLKLHKQGVSGTSPAALPGRFDGAAVFTIDGGVSAPVPPASFKNLAVGTPVNVTFKGLNFNSAYSISARAYVPGIVDGTGNPILIPGADLTINVAAPTGNISTVTKSAGAETDFVRLALKVGDFITIGSAASNSTRYRVTNVAGLPTSFDVENFGGAQTAQQFSLWRDMAAANQTTGGPGGGTAGAINTPENFINVSTGGAVTFGGGGTPTQLDMSMRLMDDFTNAFSKGTVNFTAGAGVSGGETITSP